MSNTKTNFYYAFWQIYKNKKLEKISIKELCNLAGYNRSTFYAYFLDIYDLFDKAMDDFLQESINTLNNINNLEESIKTQQFIDSIFHIFNTNEQYLEMIFKNNNTDYLEIKLKNIIFPTIVNMLEINKQDITFEYIIEYQLYAIFGIFKTWINNKRNLSKEQLITLVYQISANGIFKTILNT